MKMYSFSKVTILIFEYYYIIIYLSFIIEYILYIDYIYYDIVQSIIENTSSVRKYGINLQINATLIK